MVVVAGRRLLVVVRPWRYFFCFFSSSSFPLRRSVPLLRLLLFFLFFFEFPSKPTLNADSSKSKLSKVQRSRLSTFKLRKAELAPRIWFSSSSDDRLRRSTVTLLNRVTTTLPSISTFSYK